MNLFGPVGLTRSGDAVKLPPSRKTRALLCYLLLANSPKRRDHLCEVFWDLPDDPRGALRWSLSKLRPLLLSDDETLLKADRDTAFIDASMIESDLGRLRALAGEGMPDQGEADIIWRAAIEPLMADCELPNQPGFTRWLESERNEVARLRKTLARTLALAPDAAPEVQEIWAERWLQDAPFDPDAATCLVQATRRLGRLGQADDLAARLTAKFKQADLSLPDFAGSKTAREQQADIPKQAIRFVRSEDGTTLAWAASGPENAPPLVKAANWLSHLELDWAAPIWSPLFRDLSSNFRLFRYDERGCGLSDWNADTIDFDSFVTDLEMVVDAAGLERFPLLGISQGAAVSIEYAARHPDRVSHLILFGGYPVGWRPVATEQEAREREAVMVLTETGWGRDNPAYRHMFSQTFMPSATAQELQWFDEFQRSTTSPENAVRFLEAFSTIDVRHRLAEVQCPTLVVHSLHEKRIPVETGRSLAAQIPDAEFLGLDSPNHLLLGREPAANVMLDAIRAFLKS